MTLLGRRVIVRRQPYRRSLTLTLNVDGSVRITAPKSSTLDAIEGFLRAQSAWIDKNLARYAEVRKQFPPKRYREGETFSLFGEPVPLRFERGDKTRVVVEAAPTHITAKIPPLEWESFAAQESHPELAAPLAVEFAKLAKRHIEARLNFYSQRMGVQPAQVVFRSQKTRWGSCSVNGRISLNWRLICAPPAAIDYVVVHELSHLVHHNHSSKFWKLVATQIPDYRHWREWLGKNQYISEFLAKKSLLDPNQSGG